MSLYGNPEGKIGYNELSPYVQRLLENSGTGGGGNVYIERSYYKITETRSNILVNLPTFNSISDTLLVFKNGLFMTLGLEYILNSDKTISPINEETWDATQDKPMIFDFISIANSNSLGGSSINYVKMNILQSDWIQEDDVYYKIITHNLDSESLIFSAINTDTKRSLYEAYTLIDNNNIKVYNDEKINLSLTIIDVLNSGSSAGDSSSSAGNGTKYIATISASNFEYDSNLDMYKTTITHNLDGDDLLIGIIDNNKKSVYPVYDIQNLNSIILYNIDAIDLTISILSI